MSRRCSTFLNCLYATISTFQFFSLPPQAGLRMLRASSETASVARDLRVKRKIFPDVCISCFVVFVIDISLADCRSLMCLCSVRPPSLECTQLSVWCVWLVCWWKQFFIHTNAPLCSQSAHLCMSSATECHRNVACVGNMHHRTYTPHVLSWTFGRTVCGH